MDPSEYGKPITKTTKRTTREVHMVLTNNQLKEAISEYVRKRFSNFRGIDYLEYEFVQLNRDNDDIQWGDLLVSIHGRKDTSE